MKRLSVARDRELRHLADRRIGWRWSDERNGWLAYCRPCARDASKQVFWLIGEGWAHLPLGLHHAFVNVQPTDNVELYLERYPR